ncbi:MAG: 3-hydroxyisobutyrate dehydrogenase [Rhodobacter sp. BACL10 MAG-120419-bin15]|jgi:3-hydroxyisobutyrate dehydrogenase|nr:MAG: 3-hydroxyisobutyrate dehydrogenase [Rhodobacter sp. BACL10 MAG-120419-bin15]|tara:strand:+ start:4781 stop:5644 length:864 start_codon:yes stop_codon:yes gene_type:complete
MRVAIFGTGRMGTAFAKRLIETGNSVTVWNRTSEKTSAASQAGAIVAEKIADAAKSDILILSLSGSSAVRQVVESILEVGNKGRLIIDTSTLLPDDSREFADMVIRAGSHFVDCPVGGTVVPALKGQLLGMAGGTIEDFERARPILEQLCRRVEHMGSVGSGSHMKLAVNLPLIIYWKTLSESLAMLKESGIPIEKAISVIADSSGGPAVLKNRAQVVIDTLNGTDQIGTVDIETLQKDLELALKQAKKSGISMSISEATRDAYTEAVASKLSAFDGSSLTRYLSGY